jgi:hypothetical protein
MAAAGAQVNVRLSSEELAALDMLLDMLRRAEGDDVSRADVIRALLREKKRLVIDMRIAEAYDAAAPGDDELAESSAVVAGDLLRSL